MSSAAPAAAAAIIDLTTNDAHDLDGATAATFDDEQRVLRDAAFALELRLEVLRRHLDDLRRRHSNAPPMGWFWEGRGTSRWHCTGVKRTKAGVGEDCAICLEQMKRDETKIRITCGHVYHRRCIRKWLRRKSSCPVCRWQLQ